MLEKYLEIGNNHILPDPYIFTISFLLREHYAAAVVMLLNNNQSVQGSHFI
jgi:hypothetical protein